jgi:hypothetical protein
MRSKKDALSAFRSSKVRIRDSVEAGGRSLGSGEFAWGQFIDREHDRTQVGIYGTAAATVMMVLLAGPESPLAQAGLKALPTGAHYEARTVHDAHDRVSTFKVAAAIEACLDAGGDSTHLYRHLLSLRVGSGWPNAASPPANPVAQRPSLAPTVAAAWALRSYQVWRASPQCAETLRYLIEELSATDELPAGLDALTILTLDAYRGLSASEPDLSETIKDGLSRLRRWRRGVGEQPQRTSYHFNIVLESGEDGEGRYVYYPEQLLAALACLTVPEATAVDKRWGLDVAEETASIVARNSGYKMQSRLPTVDQLWAVRLMEAAISMVEAAKSIPLPRVYSLTTTFTGRLFTGLALGAATIGGGSVAIVDSLAIPIRGVAGAVVAIAGGLLTTLIWDAIHDR